MKLVRVISISETENNTHRPYVAVSDVRHRNGSPVLGASRPLTETEARNIFGKIVAPKKRSSKLFLPENVLFWHEDFDHTCVFYVKAGTFEISHVNWDKPKTVPFPQLVFKITKTSLNIYATKEGTKRPTPTTPLYRLPIWNVYEGGSVCLGSASLPTRFTTLQSLVDSWKAIWFKTTFAHNEKETEALWSSLEGTAKFPMKKLRQRCGKIEDII